MKLSELQTGQKALIVKVIGHGGFRKRIIEMGFVKGRIVEAMLNAPLQDPVKYKVMDYEVSLRRDEAELIEIISETSSVDIPSHNIAPITEDVGIPSDQPRPNSEYLRQRRTINVALVGNPNCGKTSLFNYASGAHARVGNYGGVTVDATVGHAHFEGYDLALTDLPGTYSLSCYSPEELFVREHLFEKRPDIVINVIDASNMERNLYLTTQLVDMNIRMVCALNMYDEFERRGDSVDIDTLSQLLGVPMIPTSFRTGRGVNLLFHVLINLYEGADYIGPDGRICPEVAQEIRKWHEQYAQGGELPREHVEDFAEGERPQNHVVRHIHINHGQYVEKGIADVQTELKRSNFLRARFSTRYLAIKLLENDTWVEHEVSKQDVAEAVMAARDRAASQIKTDTHEDSETAVTDAKYGFIHGALTEANFTLGDKQDTYRLSHAIDAVLSNKYLGFPVFFLMLYVMFQTTFSLGQYPMDWIESGVEWLSRSVEALLPDGPLRSMIVDGCIAGVGAVIVFLPQILILYLFISFMEDSGYMARAAFIMDRVMHKMGLHGKSFIPLIMGFGCNVPAVMATRTIESRRSRLITMMVLPFMSCSARLPIYIMIAGTFFAVQWRSAVMISLYVVGILMSVIVSRILSQYVIKGEDTPFVMELPPYRLPTWKATLRHTWDKGKEYLKKMGGIILVASVIVWALGYFPHDDTLTEEQQQEQSYIGRIGHAIEPIFLPQGFNWKLDVSLVAGVGAKEIVASTLGVIYSGDGSFSDDETFSSDTDKYTRLHNLMQADGLTPLSAYCYLLFILLYLPCIATIAAIKNETASWRWALFAAGYTTCVAWIVSAVVYQVGSLFV